MKQQYEHRIAETKKKVYDAFIQLTHRKDIHQISISELCQLADINRSTFYHYYGSQYDVLKEMTDAFLAKLEEKLSDVQDEAERHACISFVTYGAYQLLLEWMNMSDRISAKQEAELILKLARRIC